MATPAADSRQGLNMYLNRFSAVVVPGKEVDNGYVELQHNTEYALKLRNNRPVRCDAIVKIDGQAVGAWRIQPNSNIRIERHADIDRKFLFLKLGTNEAQQAGLRQNSDLGLVSVTFVPEYLPPQIPLTPMYDGSRVGGDIGGGFDSNPYSQPSALFSNGTTKSRSAGGTGLGAKSNQQFGVAAPMQYDWASQVIINLRLVAVDADDEPAIIPLPMGVSNPVPPPVY